MKTTIDISDPLLSAARVAAARDAAARDGVTVRSLVERGLRLVLAQTDQAPPFKLKDASFKGGRGLHPDAAHVEWEHIRRLAYDDDPPS